MRFSKVSVLIALIAVACSGSEGPEGPTGPIGPTGPTGPAAQDAGSLSGVVKDAAGAALAGVALTTVPASKSTTSAADGSFTLADLLVGSYSVVAKKAGYADATLAGVGVAAGATTADLALTMTAAPVGTGSLSGTVRNAKGDPIEGAVVASLTTPESTATTDATGAFTLANVPAGFVYVKATPPAGALLLPTETRDSKYLAGGGSVTGVNLTFSGRPADGATYVGFAGGCTPTCHANVTALEAQSAHHRSLATDTSQVIEVGGALWPAVGGTNPTNKKALGPDGTTKDVDVYLCQNTAGVFSMKFGGNADCTDGTGTLVPVSGTYGGVGSTSNYGVYKQRYFAKLADVPAAAGWTYTAGKDKDYLILPIQITQSGDGSPLLDAYKNNVWSTRERTFSRACSGCHVVGLEITYDGAHDNVVTAYDFKELNVGCESCHGPGSMHFNAPSKLNILTPKNFTQKAQGELCGMCHSGDEGHSMVPLGASAFPFNRDNEAKLGGGNFVPGVYELVNYIEGYNEAFPANPRGSVEYWPDGIHGKPHRQQLPMLQKSVHWTNPYDKMTCASCHDVHSLEQGPASLVQAEGANEFNFVNATFRDNTLCLSCHATHGPFADISVLDVAAVAVDDGGSVKDKDGVPFVPSATEAYDGRVSIAGSVGAHMEQTVKMGVAAYTPLNESSPVGRCTSCHMPKTAKSGGWTSVTNTEGKALAHGDQASHVFDVIWPAQSAALNKPGTTWDKIMPNSCGSCHAGALIYFP